MRVRGRRRCGECDHRWSYFQTGSVTCPACGSIQSISTDDEPTFHTDLPAELDLTAALSMLDDRSMADVAEAARSAAREYVRLRGFVAEGELLDLDGTVYAAAELGYAGEHLRRAVTIDKPTKGYFLSLLAGTGAGDRPHSIPVDLRWVRGLAAVDVVGAYRRDLTEWLNEPGDDSSSPSRIVRSVLDLLRSHEARIAALDGDVSPADADALVSAAGALGRYLRDGDQAALEYTEDRLSLLG